MDDSATRDTAWFDADTTTFGDRLTGAREAAGLDQADVARRLGIKTKTLRAWENDQAEPRANRAGMLAGLLGVSLMWLLSGQGDGPSGPPDQLDEDMEALLRDLRALRHDQARLAEQAGRLEKRLRAALMSL